MPSRNIEGRTVEDKYMKPVLNVIRQYASNELAAKNYSTEKKTLRYDMEAPKDIPGTF